MSASASASAFALACAPSRARGLVPRLCAVALVALGCGDPAVPDSPAWFDDVQPILLAGCGRCHGVPASGGAPRELRLDVYDDYTVGAVTISGAAANADAIVELAATRWLMPPPPAAPLTTRQREILKRWVERRAPGQLPAKGTRAENRPPALELLAQVSGKTFDTAMPCAYLASDPDRDALVGRFVFKPRAAMAMEQVLGIPHGGVGTADCNVAGFPAGDYDLTAEITDGLATTTVALGTVTIKHGP